MMHFWRQNGELGHSRDSKGFTLIEIVVALGIFSVIMIISLGTFTNFIINQRRAIAEQELQEDMRLMLELMNREIRTGFGNTFDLVGGDDATLAFRNEDRNCVFYGLSGTRLVRSQATVAAADSCHLDALYHNDTKIPINDPATELVKVKFIVQPAIPSATGDTLTKQGFVTILLRARQANATDLNIQSSVSSRQIRPYRP